MNKYQKIQLLRISKFISPIFSDFLLPHLFDFLELSQAEVFEPSLEILKPETFFYFRNRATKEHQEQEHAVFKTAARKIT